jgi:poly-gamma-glutamate synthesis protein (capsule biosynthesis protein)
VRQVVVAVRTALVVGGCSLLVVCSAGSSPHRATPTAAARTTTSTSVLPGPVTLAFAGDTQFPDILDTEPTATSSGTPLADQLKADPAHVLAPVTPVLSGADLAVVNLETAITERGAPVSGKNFHFRSPAASFTALKAAGIDAVNMANNHSLDYGPAGLLDTFEAIAASKVAVFGIGHDAAEAYRPYRTSIKGQRIAILGANDWLETPLIPAWSATDTRPGVAFSINRLRIVTAVKAVRPEVDTLVVFLHWGTEQTICASTEQKSLAQDLLAAGADIIVGSHAHRVFGAGRVGDALVAYGLGNFIYWREDGESGRSGILLVTATGRHIDSYTWVPARITQGIAIPETGGPAAADLAEWQRRRSCSGLLP